MTDPLQARDELRDLTADRDALIWRLTSIENNPAADLEQLSRAVTLREQIAGINAAIANIQRML